MAIESRVVSLNFVSGLDQKTDAKLTTKLTTADNCVLRKNGTIEKRLGFVANGNWSLSANPVKVFPFKNGEFITTDITTDAISAVETIQHNASSVGGKWNSQDKYGNVFITSRAIVSNAASITHADLTVINASATQSGSAICAALADATNDNTSCELSSLDIDSESQNTISGLSGSSPVVAPTRMVSVTSTSSTVVLVYSFAGSIVFSTATSFAFGAAASVAGFQATTPQFDAVSFNNKVYFAGKSASLTNIIFGSYDPATNVVVTSSINASTSIDILSIVTPAPGTDRIRIVWRNNTAITTLMVAFSSTVSAIGSVAALPSVTTGGFNYPAMIALTGAENIGATSFDLFATFGPSSATYDPLTCWLGSLDNSGSYAGTAFSNTLGQIGCSLASKAFLSNGIPSIVMNFAATSAQCFVVAKRSRGNSTSLRSVGRFAYGIAAPNFSTSYGLLPQVVNGSDTNIMFMSARVASYFRSSNGALTTNYAVNLISFNFSQSKNVGYQETSDSVLATGGHLKLNDGGGVVENGFLTPTVSVSASSLSTGGLVSSGTYSMYVVKEFTDRTGRTHRSTPSLPITIATSATTTNKITLYFYDGPSERFSNQRVKQTRYAIFRTTANGSIAYRDRTILFDGTGSPVNPCINPPSTSVSLTISDTTLASGDVLYTQGGALPNWTPDGVAAICEHKTRIICNGNSDDTTIYSKSFVQGEGISFAQVNTITHPSKGGRVTAYASLDSVLVGFKNRSIFIISGDGPDDTGLSGSFSSGQILFSDVGCIDQKSLCRFKDGIMFKSPDKGFYLLTRDLQLNYIGADVESYNSKTIVSSQVVGLNEVSGSAEECRFLCSDGTLLTYNYYNQQWTTATLAGCTDAVQTGGRYVVVNPSSTAANARVFQQSLTTYLDAFSNTSTTYQMTVETGWVKTADVQGFQRIWKAQLLGDAVGPGAVSVEIGYDYESAYNESYTFQMSSMTTPNYTGGAVSAPQCDWVPARQKCQAIRFRIKDYPGATGVVMKFTNISLECGVKTGVFKLPAAKGS